MARNDVTFAVTPRAAGGLGRLTVRGISDETIMLLQEEADWRGLSLNRYVVLLLDERAELRRRREQLTRLRQRLDAVRDRIASPAAAGRPPSDSAVLLWAERGGR